MSSPAPSNSGAERGKKPLEQITFRFCSECSNMLYPKEDETEKKLLFTCRTCSYSEEAQSSCIFRNVLNNAAGETAGVTQDVGSDPTVSFSFIHNPHALASWKQSIGPSSLLWCACCGEPIECGVCGAQAAIAEKDTIPPSLPTDDPLSFLEPDSVSWDMSDENVGIFMPKAEEHYDGLMEDKDEYEAKFIMTDPSDGEMEAIFSAIQRYPF